MADKKLSELTELAATPAVDDEVYIRDVSEAAANESKRITTANLIDAKAVAAVEAAGLTFAENKGIILDAVLSGDDKYSGIVEAGVAGATLAFGDIVYLASTEKWLLAKADGAATSKGKLGMVVLAAGSDTDPTIVLLFGKIRAATLPTLTKGAPVYVSAANAGDVVVTAPSGTTDFVVRIIGYGNTEEDLFFCPDNTYIELA